MTLLLWYRVFPFLFWKSFLLASHCKKIKWLKFFKIVTLHFFWMPIQSFLLSSLEWKVFFIMKDNFLPLFPCRFFILFCLASFTASMRSHVEVLPSTKSYCPTCWWIRKPKCRSLTIAASHLIVEDCIHKTDWLMVLSGHLWCFT